MEEAICESGQILPHKQKWKFSCNARFGCYCCAKLSAFEEGRMEAEKVCAVLNGFVA